ncbi:MAG: hypothetical protein AAGA68_19800 [Pseudomonadota bacterium]
MDHKFIAENDIIGQYVRNELTDDDAERFEAAFFVDRKLARLVEIEQAVHQHFATPPIKTPAKDLPNASIRLTPQRLALAASIALAVTLAPSLYMLQRLAASQEQIESLLTTLESERSASLVSNTLTLAPVRSSATLGQGVALPGVGESLVLDLKLPARGTTLGSLKLRVKGGGVEYLIASVPAPEPDQGTVRLSIPGTSLTPGAYELRLVDAVSDDILASYAFEISLK